MFSPSFYRSGSYIARLAKYGNLRGINRSFQGSSSLLSIEIKMPSLSPTMSEGQIVQWNKKEGESVNAGDVICEIQTDKAVVALESDDDGVMAKIIQAEGSGTIKVGKLIAVMAEDGEEWKEVAQSAGDGSTSTEADSSSSSSSSNDESEANEVSGGSTPGTPLKMPALSPTMTEGTIVNWNKKEGDKIEAGEVICEIQTDKAVVAMEADDDAILAKILVNENEGGVKIGTMIALTVEEGEDWKDVQIPSTKQGDAAPPKVESAAPAKEATTQGIATSDIHVEHVPGVGPASTLLMAQYGIDPSKIEATGQKGIVKGDVLRLIKQQNLKPLEVKSEPAAPVTKQAALPKKEEKPKTIIPQRGASYTDIPLTSMRSVIAKRLVQSKQTSPHGHATNECNIDAISKIRQDFLQAGIKISLNDLVIKAVATTLQYVPEVNLNVVSHPEGDDFQIMPSIDISVAVATEEGLITPIVKNVPSLSLPDISSTVKDLALRARNGQLKLDEFQGGTFTISNLGMFGINEFTAIINPPQCAILAVGKGTSELVPNMNGKATQTIMKSTLSFDRRFIDEQMASDFMSTLQRVIEHPEYMNIGPVPLIRQSRIAAQL